jgi:hypothetical protein
MIGKSGCFDEQPDFFLRMLCLRGEAVLKVLLNVNDAKNANQRIFLLCRKLAHDEFKYID